MQHRVGRERQARGALVVELLPEPAAEDVVHAVEQLGQARIGIDIAAGLDQQLQPVGAGLAGEQLEPLACSEVLEQEPTRWPLGVARRHEHPDRAHEVVAEHGEALAVLERRRRLGDGRARETRRIEPRPYLPVALEEPRARRHAVLLVGVGAAQRGVELPLEREQLAAGGVGAEGGLIAAAQAARPVARPQYAVPVAAARLRRGESVGDAVQAVGRVLDVGLADGGQVPRLRVAEDGLQHRRRAVELTEHEPELAFAHGHLLHLGPREVAPLDHRAVEVGSLGPLVRHVEPAGLRRERAQPFGVIRRDILGVAFRPAGGLGLVARVACVDVTAGGVALGGEPELVGPVGIRLGGQLVAFIEQRLVAGAGVEQGGDGADPLVGIVPRRLEVVSQLGDRLGGVTARVAGRQREDRPCVVAVQRRDVVAHQLQRVLGGVEAQLVLVRALGQLLAREPAHQQLERLITLRLVLDLQPQVETARDELLGEGGHDPATLPPGGDGCQAWVAFVRPGRLAQLVRAPALQAGGRAFEPRTAHRARRYGPTARSLSLWICAAVSARS